MHWCFHTLANAWYVLLLLLFICSFIILSNSDKLFWVYHHFVERSVKSGQSLFELIIWLRCKIVCYVFSVRSYWTLKETAVNASNFDARLCICVRGYIWRLFLTIAQLPFLIIAVMGTTHLYFDHDIQNWSNHFLLSEYFDSSHMFMRLPGYKEKMNESK